MSVQVLKMSFSCVRTTYTNSLLMRGRLFSNLPVTTRRLFSTENTEGHSEIISNKETIVDAEPAVDYFGESASGDSDNTVQLKSTQESIVRTI